MKALYGNELIKEIRHQAEIVKERLWISVPYIGSPLSIRKILGNKWFENPNVTVKLLTDISDLSSIDTNTCRLFYKRGQIKSIVGLHAKIYIFDNNCIVTSANLTNTAFSKRHEIAILLKGAEGKETMEIFNSWWTKGRSIKLEEVNKIFTTEKSADEESKNTLPNIWVMPLPSGDFVKKLETKFLDYYRIITDYDDFCKKYSSIQRIWPNDPIYIEIDGLLNYLYHYAPSRPSKKYLTNPRKLNESKQLSEIKKWATEYKNWNKEQKKEWL